MMIILYTFLDCLRFVLYDCNEAIDSYVLLLQRSLD